MKRTTSPYILLRRSAIHQKGVFAKTSVKKGTRIIEYVGEKITKKESDRRGPDLIEKALKNKEMGAVYIFELNKKYDIDGNVAYNTARYINHSCEPNCETEITRGKIWIKASRDIAKGEEITYNYGYDLDDYENHPCFCGAPGCVGYILGEEYWPTLRKRNKKKNSLRL